MINDRNFENYGIGEKENRIFQFSMLTSLLVHIFAVVSMLLTNLHVYGKTQKTIEVVYHPLPAEIHKKTYKIQKIQTINPQKIPPSPKVLTRKEKSTESLIKDLNKKKISLSSLEKQPLKVPTLTQKRIITVPVLESGKISYPNYLNYNERIRNKIKNRAYLYVDDPYLQNGEVYLTFVLLANGELKMIKVNHEKSIANDHLRSIGLRSIKESSPFPSFPGELKYPELSFNVIISFEMNK